MAGALVEGWRLAGVDLSAVIAFRPSGRPVEGVRVLTGFDAPGAVPRLVVLGFKPQQLDQVAPQLEQWVRPETTILSILAGVEVATLRIRFPRAAAVVRAMPNLPVSVRRGVIALYSEDVPEPSREQLSQLFATLGYTVWTDSEATLAAVGSIAGAGPAYVARFIAALANAGIARGLSEELAGAAALETVLGTAWMAAINGERMDGIVRRVASPNGTTEAGLRVLDHEDVLEKLVTLTISAASRRGAELAKEARGGNLAEERTLP
jgi:pyrroline-5-carboxylate reductase